MKSAIAVHRLITQYSLYSLYKITILEFEYKFPLQLLLIRFLISFTKLFLLKINYDKEALNGRPSKGLPKPTASECNAPNDFCPRSGFCKENHRGICNWGNHGECNY